MAFELLTWFKRELSSYVVRTDLINSECGLPTKNWKCINYNNMACVPGQFIGFLFHFMKPLVVIL